jgi:hypothetical protein
MSMSIEMGNYEEVEPCLWREESDGFESLGIWHTECENAFQLSEGTPSENSMRYCCYCGKPLKEIKWPETNSD